MKEYYDRQFSQLDDQYRCLQQHYGNEFGALKENFAQEIGRLKEHIDRRLYDWMSKVSFHGHQKEEECDYVHMTPHHPHTSGTSVPIKEKDNLITVAPI